MKNNKGKGKSTKVRRNISQVKRSNQKRNKLVKHGKAKPNSKPRYIPNQKKGEKSAERREPTEEELKQKKEEKKRDEDEVYSELANSISKEDAEYIARTAAATTKKDSRKRKLEEEGEEESSDDEDDDVAIHEYEKLALERMQTDDERKRKVRHMLPIKTKDGIKGRTIEEEVVAEGSDDEAEEGEEKEEEACDDGIVVGKASEVSVVELYARRKELLAERKITIGSLAANFLEAPEDRVVNLEKLVKLVDGEEAMPVELSVHRLAAASVLEILKDVTPGYKIHHPELRPNEKLKKDTARLQKYESALLRCYKSYLLKLEQGVNLLKSRGGQSLGPIELKQAQFLLDCMCQLLVAHPHFNFAVNILHSVTPLLSNSNEATRTTVRSAMEKVFRADMRGEISFHAVKLINHLVKSRKHKVRNDVVDVLLSLRIKHVNLDKEKEEEMDAKRKEARRRKLMEKNKISKQEKKRKKKLEALEKELLEARGEEGKKVKERFFTDTTKLVFTIYFRILKSFPHSKLIGSVLEGLARFAHVVNIEFFGDLVAVFQQLIAGGTLGYRDTLLATSTVFSILSGQGEALSIDPVSFYGHLYATLFHLSAAKHDRDVPLALSVLQDMLVKRKKKVSKPRVLAFCKRLSTLCLQLVHTGALAGLGQLRQVVNAHPAAAQLLDSQHEVGSGVFDPALPDPEHCSASNTTAWELSLLARHYHPPTATMAGHLLAEGGPATTALPHNMKKTAGEIFTDFDMDGMGFNPSIEPPKKRGKRGKGTPCTDIRHWTELSSAARSTVDKIDAFDNLETLDFSCS